MTNIIDSTLLPKGLEVIGSMFSGCIHRHVDLQNNIYIFVAGSMYKRVPKHCSGEWMSDRLCDGVFFTEN